MGRCTPYRIHRQSTEKKCHHRAQKHTGKNFRIHQRHIVVMHKVEESGILKSHGIAMRKRQFGSPEAGQPDTDFLDIRGQQSQSRQSGGTDGKAFARSGCSIAQGVKRIGTLTHLFTQTGHFRIATRVVSYRSVSICSKRDAQCRKHTYCGNANTIEPQTHIREVEARSKEIRSNDTYHHGNHRNSRRKHSQAYTGNYDCRRTGLSAFTQLLGRTVGLGSIVLRRPPDDDTYYQTHYHGAGNPQPQDKESGDNYQNRAEISTESQ